MRAAPTKPRMIDLDQYDDAFDALSRRKAHASHRPTGNPSRVPLEQGIQKPQPVPMIYVGPPSATMNSSTQKGFSRSMMVAGFEDISPEEEQKILVDYKYAWDQENYSVTKRTLDTWAFVITLRVQLFLLDQKWSYIGGMTPEKRTQRAKNLAIWIRESILQLGPTFIKLGYAV